VGGKSKKQGAALLGIQYTGEFKQEKNLSLKDLFNMADRSKFLL